VVLALGTPVETPQDITGLDEKVTAWRTAPGRMNRL
jgi:hypothetical protein